MDRIVEQFTKSVDLVFNDGSRASADLNVEERTEYGETLYSLMLKRNDSTIVARSEEGFFDAMKNLRMELETDGILLHCFGASEDVYPSGMQVSFGGTKAHRMRLGVPALLKDVVDIFASDDSVKPATVEQQERFREIWMASLSAERTA